MNGYDFISQIEYKEILTKIAKKEYFEYEKIIKKLQFNFEASTASCDWGNCKVKNGDYIVLFNMQKNYGSCNGCGYPLGFDEVMAEFSNYSDIVNQINRFLKQHELYKPRVNTEDYEQMCFA